MAANFNDSFITNYKSGGVLLTRSVPPLFYHRFIFLIFENFLSKKFWLCENKIAADVFSGGTMQSPQTIMSTVQFLNKYSRYDFQKGSRESWSQTVSRVVDYLYEKAGVMTQVERDELHRAIYNKEVSPSMRLMATAGAAAEHNQVSIYNCSYLPLETPTDFHDLTILLGHGVGVGFSVERVYVDKWPELAERSGVRVRHQIGDTIQDWALSFMVQLHNAFEGHNTVFDYSLIRPAGAPLMTRGGHASGPEPLMAAHEAIRKILFGRMGDKLRSIDIFDIACHIAGAIVSGGVRRSAMIAVFDRDDSLMLSAKTGNWYEQNLQRQYANISQVVDEKMTFAQWLEYVRNMDSSGSGEPGIWSRYAIRKTLPARRQYVEGMGPNPKTLGL